MLPCLLCGTELEQRTDKNKKPYFVCEPCGIQLFVRGKHGIEKLARLMQNLSKREIPFRTHALRLFEIQAVVGEIDDIKREIKQLDSSIDVLSKDKEKEKAQRLLNVRFLKALFAQLEQLCTDRRRKHVRSDVNAG